MPTLLICGRRDPIIPFHHTEVAHAAMPSSQLAVFPQAGHFPHHHDPDHFVALLRRFLAETQPYVYDPDVWRSLLRSGPPKVDPNSAIGLAQEEIARANTPSGT
jgi:hypothetical protein